MCSLGGHSHVPDARLSHAGLPPHATLSALGTQPCSARVLTRGTPQHPICRPAFTPSTLQDAEAPPMPPPAQPPPQFGSWDKVATSPYLFNAALNWYYDGKTGFYYGGEPPAWTQAPAIPQGARYESLAPKKGARTSRPLRACLHAAAPPGVPAAQRCLSSTLIRSSWNHFCSPAKRRRP